MVLAGVDFFRSIFIFLRRHVEISREYTSIFNDYNVEMSQAKWRIG